MKNVIATPVANALPKVAAIAFTLVSAADASAQQQGGYSSQEFYRQGDAFSEKVSGFFSRLFKAGSQPTNYSTPQPQYSQPSAQYSQPGGYRAPAQQGTATGQRTQPQYSYPQAPTATARTTTSGAWPGYSQPQAPNYRTPPPVTTSATAASMAASRTKPSASSSTRKPLFSSSTKTKQSVPTSNPPEPKTTSANTKQESVVKVPTQESSPYSLKPQDPEPLPLPKESFSDSTSNSTASSSKVSSVPSFPVATASKTPGRVISPYSPYKELDVKGLPSGSLAMDPTTQKVFKVP